MSGRDTLQWLRAKRIERAVRETTNYFERRILSQHGRFAIGDFDDCGICKSIAARIRDRFREIQDAAAHAGWMT